MKATELRLSAARTVNLGNYQSLRIEAGLTVTIEPGDDIEAAEADAQAYIAKALRRAWNEHGGHEG